MVNECVCAWIKQHRRKRPNVSDLPAAISSWRGGSTASYDEEGPTHADVLDELESRATERDGEEDEEGALNRQGRHRVTSRVYDRKRMKEP